MKAYDLDPIHLYTYLGLAWQAMLKESKCTLHFTRDIEVMLMVESGIRGLLTQSVTRDVKANNKHLPNYDATQESIFLGYFDGNNLYGWSMSYPLLYGDFTWVDPESIGSLRGGLALQIFKRQKCIILPSRTHTTELLIKLLIA